MSLKQNKYLILVLGVLLVLLFGAGIIFLASKFTGTNKSGQVVNYVSTANDLVAGFPDFPVYPGAQIVESRKENNAIEGQRGYSANWEVPGNQDVSVVADWYSHELAQRGWTITPTDQENNTTSEQTIKLSKGDIKAVIIIESGESSSGSNKIDISVDIPTANL